MATVTRGKIGRADMALFDGVNTTFNRKDATGGTIVQLREGDDVDVLQVYGNGTSRTRQSINDAIRSIGSNNATLRFSPGSWVIDDDLTIPSNLSVFVKGGAVFNVASGKTLTISGRVITEHDTWYTGTVVANNTPDTSRNPGNVLNFGADPTGVDDSTQAFQDAVDSDYSVTVPAGKYRIDSTITITIPKIVEFEGRQGIRTFYRQTIGGDPYDEIRQGEQARIVVTNNINVFDIQCEQVYMFGGCFDLTGTTDYTKAVFYYPIVNNGDLTGGDDYGGWAGGCWDFMVLGNYQDVGQIGIGGYAVHLDTENAPYNWAYLYLHRWRGVVYGMDKGFYCTARPAGKNISINNLRVDLQCNSTRQMFYNRGSSTNWVSGLHQARHVWQDEDEINQLASIDSSGFCNIDVEFADFGKNPVNGLYTNQKTYNLTGRCVFKQLNRIDESMAIRIVHKDVDSPVYTPRGVLPRYKSSHGLGDRGLFNPCTDDVLGPWVWAAEADSGVTIEKYQGVADSDTAVSDCVFANQSGSEVEITSATNAIPSLDVGAIFTLSDHSESANNASYKVLSTVTDGYNCEKLPDIWPNGHVVDPVDASSEAVTVTTGIGAVVDDSVTAGISVSTDITLSNKDNIFNPDGNAPSMTWNSTAITDGDYVEIHVSGGSIQLSKLFIYLGNIDDVKNEYVQVIRYTTAVVDHELIAVSDLPETLDSAVRYFEVDLGGTSLSNLIIRFIGCSEASSLIAIHGIYAGHTFFEREQQWVHRRSPGRMYGDIHLNSSDHDGGSLLRLGNYRLWVDSTGDLRIKDGVPSSDTDGTVVGAQS